MNESGVEITVAQAFDRFGLTVTRRKMKDKTIICFNCGERIKKIKLTDKGEHGVCPHCGATLFDWETVRSKSKFLSLKRAFLAYKEGHYSEETLFHFFAGFCGYVPNSTKELEGVKSGNDGSGN